MHSAAAIWWAVLVVLVLGVGQSLDLASAATPMCTPTRPDSLGPFYESSAPERDSTGQGLIISGIVRSAKTVTLLGEPVLRGGLQTRMATMMPHIVPRSRPTPTVTITTPRTSRDAIPVGHRTSMYASPLRDTVRWSHRSILSRHRQPSVWILFLLLNSLSSLCAYSRNTSDWS